MHSSAKHSLAVATVQKRLDGVIVVT